MSVLPIASDVASISATFGGMILVFIVFASARPGSNYESNSRKNARVGSLWLSWPALLLAMIAAGLALYGKVADCQLLVLSAIILLALSAMAVAVLSFWLVLRPED